MANKATRNPSISELRATRYARAYEDADNGDGNASDTSSNA